MEHTSGRGVVWLHPALPTALVHPRWLPRTPPLPQSLEDMTKELEWEQLDDEFKCLLAAVNAELTASK